MTDYAIIHSHDGAADDVMALLLLLFKHDLLATVLTPADSRLPTALEITKKVLAYAGPETPLIINDVDTPNSFPDAWRDETNDIVDLLRVPNGDTATIQTHDMLHLLKIMRECNKKIIFVETGPMTALARILEADPSLSLKIHQVVWTAGSLNKEGYNPPKGCDGTQTWNAYVDPASAALVWGMHLNIVLLTREATNKALLAGEFFDNIPDTVRGKIFKNVYSYYSTQKFYRLWDVLTVTFLDNPTAFTTVDTKVRMIATGPSQGRTEPHPDGIQVTAVIDVDIPSFNDYVFRVLTPQGYGDWDEVPVRWREIVQPIVADLPFDFSFMMEYIDGPELSLSWKDGGAFMIEDNVIKFGVFLYQGGTVFFELPRDTDLVKQHLYSL